MYNNNMKYYNKYKFNKTIYNKIKQQIKFNKKK